MKRIIFLLLLAAVLPSLASAALTTSNKAYWPFDNSATDITGGGFTAVLGGGLGYNASGLINQAVDLDNVNDHFNLSASLISAAAGTGSFSISGWFNPDALAQNDMLMYWAVGAGGTPRMRLSTLTNNTLQMEVYGATERNMFTNGKINAGQWMHIVLVWNITSEGMTLYMNGTAQATLTEPTFTTWAAITQFSVGRQWNDALFFGGPMDEWGFWNRTLSATEVTTLYNAGLGCQANYTACEGTVTPLLTINAYDALNTTPLTAFNASVQWNGSNTSFTTTNGTINTNYVINSTLSANITVSAANYFPNSSTNYANSSLNASLTPYLYNASAVYKSDPIAIAGVLSFTPSWNVYVPANTSFTANFTCNAEAATPNWTGSATNNTLTACPVSGAQFQYELRLATTNNRSTPRVLNLSVNFVLGPFTITAADATNSSALTTFNASLNWNGTLYNYSTSNGTITDGNVPRAVSANVTVSAQYYDSYSNSSYNTSNNLVASLVRTVPPAAANVSYVAGFDHLLLSWLNPDSSLVSGFRVFRGGVLLAVLNGSTTDYNVSGLATGTNYSLAIEAFTPVGAATNYSFVAQTTYNAPPVLTRVFPTTFNASLEENSTTTFVVDVESPGGWDVFVEWFVNAFSVFSEWITGGSGESDYDFETNYTASGEYNVTVVATDVYNDSASIAWNVTVADTYPVPGAPQSILPNGGEFEYQVPLYCLLGYEPVRPAYFEFVYSVNGSAYTDLNIITTDGFVVFDTSLYGYGSNFSFGCRVDTPSGVSNYTYSNNFSRVDKNHFYLFETGKSVSYNALKPYTLGFLFEGDNAIGASLYVAFVDCNGDGVWDYTFDYRDESVTRARETFACVNPRGSVETTVGVTLFKNNTASWETLGCSGLAADEQLCAVYKTYEVVVQ